MLTALYNCNYHYHYCIYNEILINKTVLDSNIRLLSLKLQKHVKCWSSITIGDDLRHDFMGRDATIP